MELFYTDKFDRSILKENQYVLCGNEVYRYENGFIKRVEYPSISNKYTDNIKPFDIYQYCAIDMLKSRQSKVKLIRGVYGSGKDYLMFNEALTLIEDGEFDRIIYVRPNWTLKNVPTIGALPGDVEDKLDWTFAPLYDKVGGKDGVDYLVSHGLLEMIPLLYIRGYSTMPRSIVYVTEAQNIDSEIAKILLSRIGEGSELWLNGDNHQTDSRIFDRDNGLTKMISRLQGNPLFGYVYLPVTHRSDVANLANLLDD
jgi:predicted ribonuclease YlaK